jgi:hypothetical protein
MAIQCVHCGTELPDDARFCLLCGKPPREALAPPVAAQAGRRSAEPFTWYGQVSGVMTDEPSISGAHAPSTGLLPPASAPDPLLLLGANVAPPAMHKGHGFRWIALVLVTLFLLGTAGLLLYTVLPRIQHPPLPPTPTSVLQTACDAYERGDKQSISHLLTPEFQQQGEASVLYAAADPQANRQKGGIVSCTVTAVSQHGIVATGTTIITYGNGGSERIYLQLVQENSKWKISNVSGWGVIS